MPPIFRGPRPCPKALPDLLPCFPLPCQPRLFLSRLPSQPTSSFHRASIDEWYFNPPVPDRRLPCGRSPRPPYGSTQESGGLQLGCDLLDGLLDVRRLPG